MLPHERSLVKRLQNEPFALLGVNSDGDAKAVKSRFAKEGITWRNAMDVVPDGPLATKWNVTSFPGIYIIDAKGMIRHRGLRDHDMEEAVMALLAEAESG